MNKILTTTQCNDIIEKVKAYEQSFQRTYLDDYQMIPVKYMLGEFGQPSRGILLMFEMGLGKTYAAIAIAIGLWKKEGRECVVLLKKSIKNNFQKQLFAYVKNTREMEVSDAERVFHFISSNIYTGESAVIKELEKYSKKKVTIVIDEVHNLISSICNGVTKTSQQIYNILTNMFQAKFVFMSGTPIISSPLEIFYYINLLTTAKINTTNMDMKHFYLHFFNEKTNTIKNDYIFANRLFGSVCCKLELSDKEKSKYPTLKGISVFQCKMSSEQESDYNVKKLVEKNNISSDSDLFKSSESYKIKTRQACNGVYKEESKTMYSTKIIELMKNLNGKEGIIIVYSQFMEFGVFIIENELKKNGFINYESGNSIKQKTYCAIIGSKNVDERYDTIKVVNSPENIDGNIIKLILISSVGIEGINFENVREVHIFEPYWYMARLNQIIARGIRKNSHHNLPEDKKNVRGFIYLSSFESQKYNNYDEFYAYCEKKSPLITTDEEMLYNSLKKQKVINQLYGIMNSVAINCGNKCKKIENNDLYMFKKDFYDDLHDGDMAKVTFGSLMVKPFTYNNAEFFYTINTKGGTNKYNIFKKTTDAEMKLVQINPNELIFFSLYKFLTNLNKPKKK